MDNGLCLVVLDHRNDEYLRDLVAGARRFVPGADIAWYDAGSHSGRPPAGITRLACSRPLCYAKVTPFFLDLLEWAAAAPYRAVVNLETDMAFVRPGFEEFVSRSLATADHLACDAHRDTPRTSRWRPYHSLRAELPALKSILGVDSTHRCFSPGQAFSRRYARALVGSPIYGRLREFVAANQRPEGSFSLQEVLLPTLTEVLSLRIAAYPVAAARLNRYRPYHASASIRRAAAEPAVHFVHPVRRDSGDGARKAVRALLGRAG
jgi:hypothetical protein